MKTATRRELEFEELVERIAYYRLHPVAFLREVLGVLYIWPKQVEILEAIRDHPRVAVAACHSSSKTYTAACAAWWFALCHQPSKVVTTAPTERQVKRLLWAEIAKLHGQARVRLPGKVLTTFWRMPDPTDRPGLNADWYMDGFSTNPDQADDHATKMVGYHSPHVFVIFDEACGILSPIYKATWGLMASGILVRWLLIGNPTDPTSPFADAYASPNWHSIRIDGLKTPNLEAGETVVPFLITPDFVEALREEEGEDSPIFLAKARGLFPDSAEDTLISLRAFDEARERHELWLPGQEIPLPTIGVDVARFGADSTAFYVVHGDTVTHCEGRASNDTVWCAGRTVELAKHYGLTKLTAHRISIDDDGVGGGVVDLLHAWGWGVNAESGASAPLEEGRFKNRRMELWWYLKKWIEEKACLGNVPRRAQLRLRGDLTAPKYKFLGNGLRQLEAKPDMRKRLGRSPDDGDALALALAGRVRKPTGTPLPEDDDPRGPEHDLRTLDGFIEDRRRSDRGPFP